MNFDFDAWLASTSTRRQWMRRALVTGGSALGLSACGSGGGGANEAVSAESTGGASTPTGGTTSGSTGGTTTGGTATARVFTHPGLLHTEADFTRMRTQLAAGREPWVSGLRALTSSSRAQLGRDPQPVVTAIRGGDGENFRAMVEDVQRAYQLALRWKVTNDPAYADQAVRYVNAWVSTMTTLTGNGDRFLAAGIYGYQWANAAEILRTYTGWSATDVHLLHRWLALIAAIAVGAALLRTWRLRRSRPLLAWLVTAAAGLMLVEILIGAANIWFELAPAVRTVHLATATIIWGLLVTVAAIDRLVPGPAVTAPRSATIAPRGEARADLTAG